MAMNIKNTLSLSLSEAVELLSKIADSLEQKREFAFDLRGQEVSIEVGDHMLAQMSISPDEFSIIFNWGENVQSGELDRSSDHELGSSESAYYEPPKMVREVKLPEEMEQPIRASVETSSGTPQIVRRALPERMVLNTSTLPLEGGYWVSAFNNNGGNQWAPINIDSELENKKWGADDQITTLADITPKKAKPKTIRKRPKGDDDLFSELDELDQKKPRSSRSSSSSSGVDRVQIPNNSNRPSGSIPAPGRSSPSPARPANTLDTWEEPKQEDNTSGDTWVKPSHILKQQDVPSAPASTQNIPAPAPKPTGKQSKRKNIPVPAANQQDDKSNDIEEVRGWKEPSPEENVTDDDWVKPSEFLKRSKDDKKGKKQSDPVNRPPPKAPDKKKDDDDKKKGWASW